MYNPFDCDGVHTSLDELLACDECSAMLEYTTISETVAAYNETLDEYYGPVLIAELTLSASDVLESCDPIAYKCGWIDWCDAEGIDTDLLEDDYTFERDRM